MKTDQNIFLNKNKEKAFEAEEVTKKLVNRLYKCEFCVFSFHFI